MVMVVSASHGGRIHEVARTLGRPLGQLLDFSASINPMGMSPSVRRAIIQALPDLVHYPDTAGHALKQAIAEREHISADFILLGNGSAELITALPRALASRHVLILGPTFTEFERAAKLAGATCTYVLAGEQEEYRPPLEQACQRLIKAFTSSSHTDRQTGRVHQPIDTVFLCNPNSPTGRVCSRTEVGQLLSTVQKVGAWLIVDEAFIDYCASHSLIRDIHENRRLIILRSFTKFYAIPGLRIGYMAAPTDVVRRTHALLPPWSVNHVAAHAALAALQDDAYHDQSLALMQRERPRFFQQLQQGAGLHVFPSSANFFLVQLPHECRVSVLMHKLQQEGLLIRNCEDFIGIEGPTIRLAIRRKDENDRLVRSLRSLLPTCR